MKIIIILNKLMGGVVCRLAIIFCCSGCQPSLVASMLAFHPPDPSYKFVRNDRTGEYDVVLKQNMESGIPRFDSKAVFVTTSTGSKIPVICFSSLGTKKTLLYSHGNATDIGVMFLFFVILSKVLECNVVVYDYTGYGASEGGPPSDQQMYEDIQAVYAWSVEYLSLNPKVDLYIYGQSVGSGPSCYIASKKDVAGLVLHAPILSGLRVLTSNRLFGCFDIFPNLDRIKEVSCPVYIIHGEVAY